MNLWDDYYQSLYDDLKKKRGQKSERIKQKLEAVDSIASTYELENSFLQRARTNRSSSVMMSAYRSPLMSVIMEAKSTGDWVPNFTFLSYSESDDFLAKNVTTLHDIIIEDGGFERILGDLGTDLFKYSEGFFQRVYNSSVGRTKKKLIPFKSNRKDKTAYSVGFLYHPFESVLMDESGDISFVRRDLTQREFLKDYPGFKIEDISDYDANNVARSYEVIFIYDAIAKKQLAVYSGKIIEDAPYSWEDENKNGIQPVVRLIGRNQRDNSGGRVSDLDLLYQSWKNLTENYNMAQERERRYSKNNTIIGSDNPTDLRNRYMQNQVDQAKMKNMPMFVQARFAQSIFAKNLNEPSSPDSFVSMRGILLEDMAMISGINIQLNGQGAESVKQESYRQEVEEKSILNSIKINKHVWREFTTTNIEMVKSGDLSLYKEQIEIKDKYSEKYGVKGEMGKVSDIIKAMKGVRLKTKVDINGDLKKNNMEELERMKNVLVTVGQQGLIETPVFKKILTAYVGTANLGISLSPEDFEKKQLNPEEQQSISPQ